MEDGCKDNGEVQLLYLKKRGSSNSLLSECSKDQCTTKSSAEQSQNEMEVV